MARKLIVEIVGDTSNLDRSFGKASKSAKGFEREMSGTTRGIISASGAFTSFGRSLAFASGSFLGAAGITAALKSSVNAASNLNEQINKSRAIFKSSSREVEEFARTTATSIGIANDQALEATGTFGNLFTTVGLTAEKNARLSTSLVKLAADLASFNNASPVDTLDALRSGLIGEAEPLRRFGVLLTETRVQQEAMRETGKKAAANLTQQEKILARYNLILKDTVPAQGDFARTSSGLANSQRTLTAEIRDLSAALGKSLEPAVRSVTRTLADGIAVQQNAVPPTKNVSLQSRALGLSLKLLGGVARESKNEFESYLEPLQRVNDALNKLNQTASKVKLPQLPPGLLGPAGTPSFTGTPPGVAGPIGTQARTGLAAQFRRSQLRLAQAQVTATDADDRRVLKDQERIIKAALRITTNLKKRTKLYQELASVEDQIRSIDQTAEDARTAAQKKHADALKRAAAARKKQLAEELAADKKQLAHDQKELARLRGQESKLKTQIRAIQTRFASQIETARQGIGDLFAGPVLQPTDDARRRTLGLGKPQTTSVPALTSDIKAQTRQFAAFQKDLGVLKKRGAPSELIRELRAQGLAAAPEAHALATAGKGTLTAFLKAFGKREALAVTTAKTVMKAQLVTLHADRVKLADLRGKEQPIIVKINLDGKQIAEVTTKQQVKKRKGTAVQRSGRNAGVGE